MSVEFKDYYKTLGVAREATADELKTSFRALARRYHPDVAKGPDKAQAEEKFKEVNEAYEVLSDPEKRKRYDELGADWQGGPMGGQGGAAANGAGRSRYTYGSGNAGGPGGRSHQFNGTGFSDFFEQFFSGAGAYGGQRSSRQPYEEEPDYDLPGQDIEADFLVTLEEALHGAVRKITLRRPADTPEGEQLNTYQVRIPAGVRDGQRIRLARQGNPGSGKAPPGDLYLRVRFARHPDFRVQDTDLYCELDLAPWEAVLGAKIKVPTLGASVLLNIPPGTASGRHIRLRHQGLPKADGERGDLYAVVRIQVPSTIDDEQRALWEKLATLTPNFKPRD